MIILQNNHITIIYHQSSNQPQVDCLGQGVPHSAIQGGRPDTAAPCASRVSMVLAWAFLLCSYLWLGYRHLQQLMVSFCCMVLFC